MNQINMPKFLSLIRIEKKQLFGIIAALIIMGICLIFLRDSKLFYFIMGIGVIIGALPFILSVILESNKEKENNEMFLEFARNLAESVRAGTPISKSILNVRNKYYGSLTPSVQKLANQISLGIPLQQAFETFARDVNSSSVTRAVMMIGEAEKAGGEIEKILDSVAKSVGEIEKLKKERMAAVYALVVQGYIIFLIFIIIMLVLEFKILPITTEMGSLNTGSEFLGGSAGGSVNAEELAKPFLYLLLVQGLFSGLIIGMLSEGNVKAGVKHSFIMVILAYLVTTGVKAFLG